MKNSKVVIISIASLIFGFFSATILNNLQHPKVDLPEEWKEIQPYDNLRGQIVDDVLIISFNHDVFFEWEGLDEDIYKQTDYLKISGRDKNIIYLNAVDE